MITRQKLTKCDSVYQRTAKLDVYGRPFTFLVSNNQVKYKTFMGAMLSVLTVITLITYMSYKISAMTNATDYKVQMQHQESYYDDSDELTQSEDGFYVGAAISNANGSKDVTVDPSIGSLKFYSKRWDYVNGLEFGFDEIPSRPCTEEDFSDPEKFFALHPAFEFDFEVIKSGMICP